MTMNQAFELSIPGFPRFLTGSSWKLVVPPSVQKRGNQGSEAKDDVPTD